MINFKYTQGLTLVELMLVMSIMLIVFGSGLFVTYGFFVRTQVDNTTNILVETTRRAQNLSRNAVSDSAWGIKINENNLVLFKANDGNGDGNPDSYSQTGSRDVGSDKVYAFSSEVKVYPASQVEIIFNKITGEPRIGGILTIVINSTSSYSRTLTINQLGTIQY